MAEVAGPLEPAAHDEPARSRRPSIASRALNLTSRFPRAQALATRCHAGVYRASRGLLGGRWINRAPVMLIETRGRRSGKPRVSPVIFARDGRGRFVVTAANAGAERVPAWWLNLRATGLATVEVGGRRMRVRAHEAAGAERERLRRLLRETAPAIEDYAAFTSRTFPVILLEAIDG